MKIPRAHKSRMKGRPYYAFLYAKNVLKDRLPEDLEDLLSSDPQSCLLYAQYVMKGRLPDHLHAAMVIGSWSETEKPYVKKYLEDFGEQPKGSA